ncbi:hypothetical protein ACWD3J_12285 [Streptomyces sp. NPDC002755]
MSRSWPVAARDMRVIAGLIEDRWIDESERPRPRRLPGAERRAREAVTGAPGSASTLGRTPTSSGPP